MQPAAVPQKRASRARLPAGDGLETWRSFYTAERVLDVRGRFEQTMAGWLWDVERIQADFDRVYSSSVVKLRMERLVQSHKSPTDPDRPHEEDGLLAASPPKSVPGEPRAPVVKTAPQAAKEEAEEEEEDPSWPSQLILGRPATQQHYSRLIRFAKTLGPDRRLPFLLRTLNVEEDC